MRPKGFYFARYSTEKEAERNTVDIKNIDILFCEGVNSVDAKEKASNVLLRYPKKKEKENYESFKDFIETEGGDISYVDRAVGCDDFNDLFVSLTDDSSGNWYNSSVFLWAPESREWVSLDWIRNLSRT